MPPDYNGKRAFKQDMENRFLGVVTTGQEVSKSTILQPRKALVGRTSHAIFQRWYLSLSLNVMDHNFFHLDAVRGPEFENLEVWSARKANLTENLPLRLTAQKMESSIGEKGM